MSLISKSARVLANHKGKSSVRLILDNPAVAKSILDRQKTDYAETEVAKVTLTHRPGELARAVCNGYDQGQRGVKGGVASAILRKIPWLFISVQITRWSSASTMLTSSGGT
jgi:hypothetical protein